MPAQILYEVDGRRVVVPLESDELTIGRDPSNDVVIGQPHVSRWHAKVYRTSGGWSVMDLESKCGIQINDKKTADGALADGDCIFIEDICLTFMDEGGSVPPRSTASVVALTPAEADTGTVFRPAVDFTELGSIESDVTRLQRLLKMVSETSRTLLESSDLDETFQSVLDIVFEALPAQRGCIMLWDEAEQSLVARCVKNNSRAGDSTIHFSRTIAEKVYREKVSVMTTDAQHDDRFAAGDSVVKMGIRSAMAAPLWHGDMVDGLIYIDTALRAEAFNQDDVDLLSALANHLAVAIEQSQLQEAVISQRLMRRRLERYHSPAVVERIAAGGEGADQALMADEREATVLFADLVGFTDLCEGMNPRDVVKLLNHYFSELTEVVFRHEGTVDKFIGDCIMAVFGAPVATKDHARRAADAALEMRQALRQLNEALPEATPLRFRVGIHSGKVVAGDIGSVRRADYTVLGATVNLAARLESTVALPDQIVISDTTKEALPGSYVTKFAGDRELKGISRRVACYELQDQIQALRIGGVPV